MPETTWSSGLDKPVTQGEFDNLAEAFWRGEAARNVLRNQHRDVWEPPIVASLPRKVEAHDGMRVKYRPARGVTWEFTYDPNTQDDFKWVYTGGPPMTSSRLAEDSTAAAFGGVPVYFAGPAITVPLRGIYNVHVHGVAYQLTAGCQTIERLDIVGVTGLVATSGLSSAQDHRIASSEQGWDIDFAGEQFFQVLGTVFNVGAVIQPSFAVGTGGTGKWRDQHMTMTPVRVQAY